MNKKVLTIVISVLVVAIGVLAFLNAGNVKEKKELEMNAEFYLVSADGLKVTVNMKDMLDLKPVDFTAVRDTSTTDPTEVKYTGVELKKILDSKKVKLDESNKIEVKALDGYASALSYDEVLQDENVYIVLKCEQEPLKTKAEGGTGPYMMIVRSSAYSQRWCKFVQEVDIK